MIAVMGPDNQPTAEAPVAPLTNYQKIQQEIDTGNIREDVWIEAYAKGLGNYNKAVSIYITMRADQMYKENTTFFRRTGNSVVQQFDPKNRRGKWLIITAIFAIGAASLFGAQPMLRANAVAKYKSWCTKARELGLPGKNTTFLLQHFGRPESIVPTTGSVTYVYNPCSRFCFNKDRFFFKVTVSTDTATISGWEWNAAFDAPESP
jgi:hypothetical protein